jgi:glutamate racemase
VSSAEETAKDVLRILSQQDMLADDTVTPTRVFESTGDPALFKQLAARFMGPNVV